MKQSVLLVQRGIASQVHPVSGKSLKQFGIATQNPAMGGVAFEMSLDDYLNAAHDLIGNTQPGQQWVPIFVPASSPNGVTEKCGIPLGCRFGPGGKPADATYVWERFFFCSAHAPTNATALVPNAPPLGTMPETATEFVADAPDVHAQIVERGVGGTIQDANTDTPPEQIRSVVGTADELPEEAASGDAGSVQKPVPVQALKGPTKTVFGDPADGPPKVVAAAPAIIPETVAGPERVTRSEEPKNKPVTEILGEMVNEAVGKRFDALENRLSHLFTPQAQPAARKAKKVPASAPTQMQQLQAKAKGLGIKTFGVGRAALEVEIAKIEKQVSGDADSRNEDIFAPVVTTETS